ARRPSEPRHGGLELALELAEQLIRDREPQPFFRAKVMMYERLRDASAASDPRCRSTRIAEVRKLVRSGLEENSPSTADRGRARGVRRDFKVRCFLHDLLPMHSLPASSV